jgi:hypothetical protein
VAVANVYVIKARICLMASTIYSTALKFIVEFACDKYAGGSGVCIIAGLCLLENYANIQGGLQVFLTWKKAK